MVATTAIEECFAKANDLLQLLAHVSTYKDEHFKNFIQWYGDNQTPEQIARLQSDLVAGRRLVARLLREYAEIILESVPTVRVAMNEIMPQIEFAYAVLGDFELPGLVSGRCAWPVLEALAFQTSHWANQFAYSWENESLFVDPKFITAFDEAAKSCPYNDSHGDAIHRRLRREKSQIMRDWIHDSKPNLSPTESVEYLKNALQDSHNRNLRFKNGTGFWPVDEPQQWYAWGVQIFGDGILRLPWQQVADLIYGKLSMERDRKIAAGINPDEPDSAGPSRDDSSSTPHDEVRKPDTVGCLYPAERCLIWGGKRFERLTKKMIDVLAVLIEQFEKGFPVVPVSLIQEKTGLRFDGAFITQAFKQNRKGEPPIHSVASVIEKIADGEYRMIDPDKI